MVAHSAAEHNLEATNVIEKAIHDEKTFHGKARR